MNSRSAAVVSLVSAVLGGLVALAVAGPAGLFEGPATTVVSAAPATTAVPAVVRSAAKPLLGNGFHPATIYAARSPGVVTIFAYFGDEDAGERAQGSGFVVSSRGYVLTNAHVVTTAGGARATGSPKAADRVYVEFSDHDRVPARIVGWDVFDDVGLVRLDPSAHALVPVPLGRSAGVRIGDPVAAIGSPFGNENSLSVGVVSARRTIDSLTSVYDVVDAIQTDAPITHGNSGGPLFDARGRVVGINAQINTDRAGTDGGVGFAIPIDTARESMRQLVENGHVAYGYAGVQTQELTPTLARSFHYPRLRGAVVTTVRPGSPADHAGLRGGTRTVVSGDVALTVGGDLLVAVAGRPIRGNEDVGRLVATLPPGNVVPFTIYRGRRRLTVPVRLGERPLSP